MAIKKYQRTAQLFDKNNADLYEGTSLSRTDEWYYAGGQATIIRIPCESSTTYTLKITASDTVFRISTIATDDIPVEGGSSVSATTVVNSGTITEYTFTTSNDAKYILFQGSYAVLTTILNTLMLNLGSTSLPYEPYGNTWNSIPYRKYGTETDTITTFPADVIADGQSASADIIGNMVQTGTPSPSSIIMPSECGDKTANLLNYNRQRSNTFTADENYYIYGGVGNSTNTEISPTNVSISISDNSISVYSKSGYGIGYIVEVQPNTTYTLSFDADLMLDNKTYAALNLLTEGLQFDTMQTIYDKTYSFTTNNSTKYVYIVLRVVGETCVYSNIMLNLGSTALPYEPYGYKIPILSGGTTTPVYLGEVESTRQIRKYEFTGQETWAAAGNSRFRITIADYLRTLESAISVVSHYESGYAADDSSRITNGQARFLVSSSGNNYFYICDADYRTEAQLKTYLQQQYSNGTPVTVWYVLATPTTGIVNEPIRKIGDYADSVSGITIPTATGKDTFDVQTTLKPSEVSLAYTGWHDASAKEWDGSEWQ